MENEPAVDAPSNSPFQVARTLFARSDDPYAGGWIENARRFAVAMWVIGTFVVAALAVFFPPDQKGVWGWVFVTGGVVFAAAVVYVLKRHPERAGYDFLYYTLYVGVVSIAVTQWAAGGRDSPFHEVYLFLLLGVALLHTPRRFVPFVVFVGAAAFAPIFYSPTTAGAGEIATELVLWTGLSFVALLLIRGFREQRTALRRDGDDARELARVDSLTGLGNRRAFDEALDAELAGARRTGTPLCLLVSDLDGFKEINDLFGHVQGDACLRAAAITLGTTVRRPNRCFRWGGDEFAVLLPGTDAAAAQALATRVELAVAHECSRPDGGLLRMTCGYAELASHLTGSEAMAETDAVLMQLKAERADDFTSALGPVSR
jgi:diguanylate cyclase (GGDEF)-like protein